MSEVVHNDVTIKGTGEVAFAENYHCTWYTTNGSTSTIIIRNPGDNELTFAVSGAPDDIEATGPDGSHKKLNVSWKIPPKQPRAQVLAFGNFRGTVVSIMNLSNPGTGCEVITKV